MIKIFAGDLFSYLGEIRIEINNVAVIDYTGWTLTAELLDRKNVVWPTLTYEWIDITLGLIRLRILPADTLVMEASYDHLIYIKLETPAGDPITLPPVSLQVVGQ